MTENEFRELYDPRISDIPTTRHELLVDAWGFFTAAVLTGYLPNTGHKLTESQLEVTRNLQSWATKLLSEI